MIHKHHSKISRLFHRFPWLKTVWNYLIHIGKITLEYFWHRLELFLWTLAVSGTIGGCNAWNHAKVVKKVQQQEQHIDNTDKNVDVLQE